MRTKILIGAAIVAAFVGGALTRAYVRPGSLPDQTNSYAVQSPAQTASQAPAATDPQYAEPQDAPQQYSQQQGTQPDYSQSQDAQPEYSQQQDAQPQYAQPQYSQSQYSDPAPVQARPRRSLKRQALIVGGSAAAGTAIGAVAGGGKGAAVGAVSGGVAGLIYDLFTKNR